MFKTASLFSLPAIVIVLSPLALVIARLDKVKEVAALGAEPSPTFKVPASRVISLEEL